MELLSFLSDQFVLFFADWGIDVLPLMDLGVTVVPIILALLVFYYAMTKI